MQSSLSGYNLGISIQSLYDMIIIFWQMFNIDAKHLFILIHLALLQSFKPAKNKSDCKGSLLLGTEQKHPALEL